MSKTTHTREDIDLYEFLTGRCKDSKVQRDLQPQQTRSMDERHSTLKAESSRRPQVKVEIDDEDDMDDDRYIWVQVESNSEDGSGSKGWKCDMSHICNLIRPEIAKAINESQAEEETYRMKLLKANLEDMKSSRKVEERKLELLHKQLKLSEDILQVEMEKLALESKKLETFQKRGSAKTFFWKRS